MSLSPGTFFVVAGIMHKPPAAWIFGEVLERVDCPEEMRHGWRLRWGCFDTGGAMEAFELVDGLFPSMKLLPITQGTFELLRKVNFNLDSLAPVTAKEILVRVMAELERIEDDSLEEYPGMSPVLCRLAKLAVKKNGRK